MELPPSHNDPLQPCSNQYDTSAATEIIYHSPLRVNTSSYHSVRFGVPTKRLNEQVMRNKKRFPSDFMFQLTAEEVERLRSQFATLKPGRGQHRKYLPYAFTEQGVAMLSSVLHSEHRHHASICSAS
jgi:hypothetical protein